MEKHPQYTSGKTGPTFGTPQKPEEAKPAKSNLISWDDIGKIKFPKSKIETQEEKIRRLKKSIVEKRGRGEKLTDEEVAVWQAEIEENQEEIRTQHGIH